MTEDLWYHALKFLDKYRTDVQSHDISELYQFADQTGVLDRHKQLLSQPFNNNQVDMKIMYYELIKMLIDYERLNHPHSYDATKTVGKIEGYQELTNKLQRYLNQRFIGDIDELGKKQSKITQMFGGDSKNINWLQKIENLEQYHLNLQTNFAKLEETNKKLLEEMQTLKDKELEMTKNVTIIHEKHEEFESNNLILNQEIKNTIGVSEEKIKSMETYQVELSKKLTDVEKEETVLSENYMSLKEQIEAVDKDGRAFQNNLTNLFNQQKEELEEITKEQISSFSDDLMKVNEQGLSSAKQIEETQEKVEELEQNIPNLSHEFVSKIDAKLSEFVTITEKRFETAEETITDTQTEIERLIEKSDKNCDEIRKVAEVTKTTNDNLTALTIKSNETWLSVENKLENHNKSVKEIQDLVDMNSMKQEEHETTLLSKLDRNNHKTKEDIDILSSQINKVIDNMEKTKNISRDNNSNIINLTSKMTNHADIFETIDMDFQNVNDTLEKAVDNIESLNKTTQVFETHHIETVERMKELTVMTSNIESYVMTQEQKLEQEKANDFNQFNGQLQELRVAHANFSTKITDVEVDNITLLEQINALENTLDSRFQELDSAYKELLQKIEERSSAQDARINMMDLENKTQLEKILQIEDAYQVQIQKAQYMDSIQSRLNHIEESKQLTDAKVRDEVDTTLKMNQSKIDMIQENVLNKIENIQEEIRKNENSANDLKTTMEESIKYMKLMDQQHQDGIVKYKIENEHVKNKINVLKNKLDTCVNDQNQAVGLLKESVLESLTENCEKVSEAEGHVNNLRELNVKLLDQVKERMVAHEAVQENTIEDLRRDNEHLLSEFKIEVNKNMNVLVDNSKNSIQENITQLSTMQSELTQLRLTVVEHKQNIDAIKNDQESNEKLLESKSEHIDGLSESVLNLESRYSETIERIEQVDVFVSEYEVKTKEMGLVFKDEQRKEMKSIENQLNTIYAEYEKIEKDINDIKTDKFSKEKTLDDFLESFNKDVELKFEDFSKQTFKQTELMAKTDSKMTAIIEQASMLMVNDVKQDQTTNLLDKSLKSLDAKLSNLESADLFLQESHRQLTEKTMSLETQSNKLEDIQIHLKNQQREKMEENLKGKVIELLSTVGEIVSEQDILNKTIVSVESLLEQTRIKVDIVESKIPELKTQILEKKMELDEITKAEVLNINEINERTMESLSNLQIEIKNALGSIIDLKKKTDDRFQRVKSAGNVYDSNMKEFQQEIKEVKGLLVSLQFQAEKAQYVETLATKVSQIDEARQKQDAETKDDFEVLVKRNQEEINQLKTSFMEPLESLQQQFSQEKVFTKSEFEDISNKIKDITNETKTHEDTLSELEPYTQGIHTKVAELENNIHERIGLLATEQVQAQKEAIASIKKEFENENELIVKRFSEQKGSIESIYSTLEQQFEKIGVLQANEVKCLEGVNQNKIAFSDLEGKLNQLDQFGAEQNSLILAVEKTVTEKFEEIGGEVRENAKKFRDEIHNIRNYTTNDRENLWTLVVEIYSSFRGYTLVVKSEGAVSEHQSDVLGVYRMVDSYNDRPVYKQDGGENYIYYSSASASWLVGTVVGHQYGWLRNGSTAASSARWLPDLSSGWEYRPLVRGEDSLSSWQSDDGTLRIEALRDVEKVTELIRDIKKAAEVD